MRDYFIAAVMIEVRVRMAGFNKWMKSLFKNLYRTSIIDDSRWNIFKEADDN